MFYCEFCKIFKNTFFIEHLWATAPVISVHNTELHRKKRWVENV